MSRRKFGAVEEEVEEGDAVGLVVVVGVVALAGEDGANSGPVLK